MEAEFRRLRVDVCGVLKMNAGVLAFACRLARDAEQVFGARDLRVLDRAIHPQVCGVIESGRKVGHCGLRIVTAQRIQTAQRIGIDIDIMNAAAALPRVERTAGEHHDGFVVVPGFDKQLDLARDEVVALEDGLRIRVQQRKPFLRIGAGLFVDLLELVKDARVAESHCTDAS